MKIPGFIKNDLLLKVTSANTLLVLVRMVFSLLSQKVLAVLIGAEGIAQVGNLKNVIRLFEEFSIIGTSNGLVKYISEHRNNKTQLNHLFSTTFFLAALAALLSFFILFFWSTTLSYVVFGNDRDYSWLFVLLSFIIPFMGVNSILNSILNGVSDYKMFSKTGLITVFLSTILIISFTYYKGLEGSLLAIVLIPIIHFLTQIIYFSKFYTNYINLKKITFNLSFKKQLLSYSFMTLVVVFIININDIIVRDLIEKKISLLEAGYWTAMTSISKIYMQFLAAIFPLYILPRYAKLESTFEFRSEVKKIYSTLLPLIVFGMVMIFLFRNLIIELIYTAEFLSMSNLFKWQLAGDFIKFVSIVISYQFLAKRKIFYFLFTEALSVFLFYGFAVYYIESYGTEGVVIAHFVRYSIYCLVVFYILRGSFIGKNKRL